MYIYIYFLCRPAFEDLASKESAWGALSLGVVEASLNVSAEFGELFKSNIGKNKILIPPED